MLDKINPKVLDIYNKLKDSEYEVYFVGGCVRNLLMDIPVQDWDITTNATPDKIQEVFPESFYDNSYGTVSVHIKDGEENPEQSTQTKKDIVEITTYRTERGYEDHRHPEVAWGKTLEEDIIRRDFTVNALALNVNNNDTEIIDLVNGQSDLENKIIRAVGNPNERFKEDSLRLLRAIRFCAQLGFVIEDQTLEAIKKDAHLISHVSGERINQELLKILSTENSYEGVILLDAVGILDIIFPELAKGKGVSQARPGRHHTTDVFTHNILSMKECPTKDPIVKLAALLHDVGKPFVASTDETGHIIFYNHEVEGSKISKEISSRLKLSNKQKDKIYTLIRWHMFTVDENITDSAVRRFIRRVGLENVKDMIDLRIGDRLGGGTQTAESWRLKNFKERLEEQLNPPFSINDLAIDGNDIMTELNLPQGKAIGDLIQKLFTEVDEDITKNNKDFLIKRLHEIYTK